MKNAIILLFSFCFLILFNSCKTEPAISNATLLEFNNILDKNFETYPDRFYKIEQEIRDDYNKPEKYKYVFLLSAANKALGKYSAFIHTYQMRIDSLRQFSINTNLNYNKNFLKNNSTELSAIDQLILSTFDSLLTENYKVIGLRYDEMKKRLKLIRNDLSKLDSTLMPSISNDIERNDLFEFKSKSIRYAATHKAYFFIERFRELIGGRVSCYNSYVYPLIQTKRNAVKKGDYFEADIHLGNRYDFHPTDEPKVVINGDTLDFDKDKNFIPFKYLTKQKGEEKLKFEFLLYNRFTGEKYTTGNEYIIYVN